MVPLWTSSYEKCERQSYMDCQLGTAWEAKLEVQLVLKITEESCSYLGMTCQNESTGIKDQILGDFMTETHDSHEFLIIGVMNFSL
jgi:hypothetical protein